MAAEEQPPPTPQAAPVQPEVPPVVRKQTPAAAAAPEDRNVLLERFLHLRPPTFVGDRDPDRAESWVHELERTFETMDCAELDQVRLAVYQLKGSAHEWWRAVRLTRFQGKRLEQISWQQFLEAFLGEYLPDYVCRERRDLFHELVQGDLTVGQYHQSGESYGPGAGVSVSAASEWRFREIFSVPVPRRQSGECVIFFLFGNRRCCPDHEVEEVVHLWRQASLAAAEASNLAVSSGAVRSARSRAEPAGFGLLALRAGGALQARVSVEAAAGAAPAGTSGAILSTPATSAPAAVPGLRERAVAAVLTVRPWIFQQVLEAQSADEDLADVLRLPEVDLTFDQGIATCPMSPSGLLKATGPMSPSHVQNLKCPSREHKPQFVSLLGEGFSSGELRLGDSVGGLGGSPWCFFASTGLVATRTLSRPVQKGYAGLSVAILMATPCLSPSQTEKGLRHLLSALEGLSVRQVVTVTWDPWSPRACVRGCCSRLRGETSQHFPPWRSEETGPQ
ncbi:hypothetical protein Taro_047380 [Colocasia esculenta]|uniref:Retrotransposon gag domain-containing protein n=1 Tax=Colocasia esculenta TaxID=4460 RepID=A0A843X0V8_COLES|nr:hypothetical protein [Colocasia esculenta]